MTEATIALVVILFALLLSSAPIAVALGGTAFLYFLYFTTTPLTQVPERLFNSLNTFPLMAIPFFVLAANIMSRGGISKRLTDLGNAMVGHYRGGMAMTAVLSCMFFAAISGSSGWPSLIALVRSTIRSMNRSAIDSCTKIRDGQVQTSPWFKANSAAPSRHLSKNSSSASITLSKNMFGDLPPSSSVTGIRFCEAYCIIKRPVVVSPVNATFATRSDVASGFPASGPNPLTMFKTPGGSPASTQSFESK